MELVFNYDKLRNRIKEILGTQDRFAKEIGLGRVSVSQSLNNQREFSAGEMLRAAQVLQFSTEEIPSYFFDEIVQKHELFEQSNGLREEVPAARPERDSA